MILTDYCTASLTNAGTTAVNQFNKVARITAKSSSYEASSSASDDKMAFSRALEGK